MSSSRNHKDSKERKHRHTISLSTVPAAAAAAVARESAEADELERVEALLQQLPPVGSPRERERASDKERSSQRRRHSRRTVNLGSPRAEATSTSPRAVVSPRLPSLEDMGVTLSPVVQHMIELDRLKRRDEVKAMLAKCSSQDRAQFKYELQRRKLIRAAQKEAAEKDKQPTPPPPAVASHSGNTLSRSGGGNHSHTHSKKDAAGASASPAPSAAAASSLKSSSGHRRRESGASGLSSLSRSGKLRDEVRAQPAESQSAREHARRSQELSISAALQRILDGELDDVSSEEQPPAPPAPALITNSGKQLKPASAASSPSDKANRPRKATTVSQSNDIGHLSINSSLKRILAGDIDDMSSEDHDARPPPPPPSSAPPIDMILSQLSGTLKR